MIQALRSLGHNQFEWAKWYEKNRETYKLIQVSIVSEDAKRWDTVIQNIITESDSTVLLTEYACSYATGQQIYYRDKWWEIVAVGEKSLDVNPQVLSLIKPQFNMQHVLELRRVQP